MTILSLLAAGNGRVERYPYDFPTARPYNVPIYAPTPTYITEQPWSGQALHPSVVVFDAPWNRWRYWMAMTPYPTAPQLAPKADWYENPSILVSHDGYNWTTPPGLVNPLDTPPSMDRLELDKSTYYNTDTELSVGPDGELVLLWRGGQTYNVTHGEQFSVRTSTDGVSWTTKQLSFRSGDGANLATHVSPCLNWDGQQWRLHTFNMKNGDLSDRSWTSPSLAGPWTRGPNLTYTGTTIDAYHVGIRYQDGLWWGTFQSGGKEYPGISTDGYAWSIGPAYLVGDPGNPRQWDPGTYRTSLWVGGDVVHVWYSTLVENRLYGSRIGYTRVPRSVWTSLLP